MHKRLVIILATVGLELIARGQSSVRSNSPFITVSPHGMADHVSSVPNCGLMYGIDTPGTTTGGLQEAVNALNGSGANLCVPAGGKIEIGPGTVYTHDTVNFNGANCTYVLEGAGLSASGVLYMGVKNVPVLYFGQPTNFPGISPQFFLRDLFVAATNDIESCLLAAQTFGKIGIEDCWFGYYPFMSRGKGANGWKTFGFEPPSYGGTTARRLCGIHLEGSSLDNLAWINNCDFSGLACGLINGADHAVVDNNMFLFCGQTSTWPNVGSRTLEDNLSSLLSLGACIVQGHSVHMNCRYHNNYFYGGNFAYAMDDPGAPDAVMSDGDGFERMNGDIYISPQSKFTQMNLHGEAPKSWLINSSYQSALAPYRVLAGKTSTSIRTVRLNADGVAFSGFGSVDFGDARVKLKGVPTNFDLLVYAVLGGLILWLTRAVWRRG